MFPQPKVPRELRLEQAQELGRGNAIFQLHQNFETPSTNVATITTILREKLVSLRIDPGWGGRGTTVLEGGNTPLSQPSSSQDHNSLRRRMRPLSQPLDDLMDTKFDPLGFEGSLNTNLYLSGFNDCKDSLRSKNILRGWIWRLLPLNSRVMLLFGLKTSKGKEAKKVSLGLGHGPNWRN